jgi:ABC-2 type transport system ATP-binding protein
MPTMHPSAIQIAGLRKSFKDNHVLRGIDLDIPSGIVFALLGANGAGKTTAINILTTLLTPDAGTVRVAGYDVVTEADKVRASIGVTGQFAAVDGLLTGEENLRMMARLAHLDTRRAKARTAELLEQFDLTEVARKPTATYSGGMGRRLDLAMSLVLNPAIVFLDEPTTGVDPRGRAVMWDIVRGLAEQGTTIFLTTPAALAAAARMLPTATVDGDALSLRVAGAPTRTPSGTPSSASMTRR